MPSYNYPTETCIGLHSLFKIMTYYHANKGHLRLGQRALLALLHTYNLYCSYSIIWCSFKETREHPEIWWRCVHYYMHAMVTCQHWDTEGHEGLQDHRRYFSVHSLCWRRSLKGAITGPFAEELREKRDAFESALDLYWHRCTEHAWHQSQYLAEKSIDTAIICNCMRFLQKNLVWLR